MSASARHGCRRPEFAQHPAANPFGLTLSRHRRLARRSVTVGVSTELTASLRRIAGSRGRRRHTAHGVAYLVPRGNRQDGRTAAGQIRYHLSHPLTDEERLLTMQSLSGTTPVPSIDAPTRARHWHRCQRMTSGLAWSAKEVMDLRWPEGLEAPFDTGVEATLMTCEALQCPGELRALSVGVVPCLVLSGGHPPLSQPVPGGTDWSKTCVELVASVNRVPSGSVSGSMDELTHAVSHDVRAPLLGAARLIDLLLEGPEFGTAEREALQQAGCTVRLAVQRLEAIRNVLVLNGSPPAPHRIDAGALVHELATDLEVAWPNARRQLTVTPTLEVYADREQLHLALRELLDNAFKFSHRVDTPEVSVTCHQVPGYDVLAVTDNGPGFNASHADRMFGLFQRMHLASEFPGLGAGLALVRRVAERHGGWAWADLGTPGRTTLLLALAADGTHDE